MLTVDPPRALVIDRLDSRVLGALRFADATTGRFVLSPLEVGAPGVAFLLNRSGIHVITAARGLEGHTTAFAAPPALPPSGSIAIVVTVRDPSGRYLPRSVRVTLPRDPDPAHAADDASLFRAVPVPLYPAPAAPIYPGWAVVRASVKRGATEQGVPNAWLRLRRASQPTGDDPPLGAGMADGRGEALVAVSGIPVTNWDAEEGPVLASEIDAVVEAYVDPLAAAPPDPDAINSRRATLTSISADVKLASGRAIAVRLRLPLP
jgi:hypothetical protein